ncbi:hypothetical protein FisN_10Hh400 [Fistulifera solaris]|uniref:Uncharacterized protein n=1 Tax=Fistulifera solaris TaxID=1519565 RepID=A0A1Z5JRA6_FISSO|nr:hypothetical protein FisN_10Hh400 [Fistulifera solaris]|eukprot:GAX16382.1 hypothetical protein FisN_10Hh400 [Fistulifera solaris]
MQQASHHVRVLERIPDDLLSERQKKLRPEPSGFYYIPVYHFVRAPDFFEDLELPKYRCLAIWMECGALVCFSGSSFDRDDKRTLSLNIEHDGDPKYELECVIFGESNEALAEAATVLCSLKEKGDSICTRLKLYAGFEYDTTYTFDFRAFRPEQLAKILHANPKRHFDFRLGNWSPEQSVILATRPFPLNLTLAQSEETTDGWAFQDGGTAFIDALEQRTTSFGSLAINFPQNLLPFSRNNLIRLFQLDVLDKLTLCALDPELVLLPFSAKVKALQYEVDAKHIPPHAFHSLNIVTKDLDLRLYLDHYHEDWDGRLISFLNRVSALGNFKRLGLSMNYRWDFEDGDEPFFEEPNYSRARVRAFIDALTRTIRANPTLTCVDLSEMNWKVELCPHMKSLFKALERHASMRILSVREYPTNMKNLRQEVRDRYAAPLEELLLRNENITVLDIFNHRCFTFHSSKIAEIYQNRFYHGSERLVKDCISVRPMLMCTAVVQRASKNFRRTACLLSDHTDILCQLFKIATEQEEHRMKPPSRRKFTTQSVAKRRESHRTASVKRATRTQPSRASKKRTKNEK